MTGPLLPREAEPTINGSLYEVYTAVPPLDDRQIYPSTLFDADDSRHPLFQVLNKYIENSIPSPPSESVSRQPSPHILPKFNAFLQQHVLRYPQPDTDVATAPENKPLAPTELPDLSRVFTDIAEKFATAGLKKESLEVLDGGLQRGLGITGEHYTELAVFAAEHGDTAWAMALALDNSRILYDVPPPQEDTPTPQETAERITIWLERTSQVNHAAKVAIAKGSPLTQADRQLDRQYAEKAGHFLDPLSSIPREVLMAKEKRQPDEPQRYSIIERLASAYMCFQKNTVSPELAEVLAAHIRQVPGFQAQLNRIERQKAADRRARCTEAFLVCALLHPKSS
jgi:hypothetical protein